MNYQMNLETAKKVFSTLENVVVVDDEIEENLTLKFENTQLESVEKNFEAGTDIFVVWQFLEINCRDFSIAKEMQID